MAKVDGFTVFQKFNAIRKHFDDSKYDYHKDSQFIGNKQRYQNFRCRSQCERIAASLFDDEIEMFLVSNMLVNPNVYLPELVGHECKVIFTQWKLRNQSLTQRFTDDLNKIVNYCAMNSIPKEAVCVSPDRKMPIMVRMVLDKEIDIETFCILDNMLNMSRFLNRDLAGDPRWDKLYSQIKKYRKFIVYDHGSLYTTAKLLLG